MKHVNIVQQEGRLRPAIDLESEFTSGLPTESSTSASQPQTHEHAYSIEAEALIFVQRNHIRRGPPVSKSVY